MSLTAASLKRSRLEYLAEARTGQLSQAIAGLKELRDRAQSLDPSLALELALDLTQLLIQYGDLAEAQEQLKLCSHQDSTAQSENQRTRYRMLQGIHSMMTSDFMGAEAAFAGYQPDPAAAYHLAFRNNHATFNELTGRYDEAAETYMSILKQMEEKTADPDLLASLANAVRVSFRLGHFSQAQSLAERAADYCSKAGFWVQEVRFRLVSARALLYCGKLAKAHEQIEFWGSRAKSSQSIPAMVEQVMGQSEFLLFLGDYPGSMRILMEARELIELCSDATTDCEARLLWFACQVLSAFMTKETLTDYGAIAEMIRLFSGDDPLKQAWSALARAVAGCLMGDQKRPDFSALRGQSAQVGSPMLALLVLIFQAGSIIWKKPADLNSKTLREAEALCEDGLLRCNREGLREFALFFRILKLSLVQLENDEFTAERERELLGQELRTHCAEDIGPRLLDSYLKGFDRQTWYIPEQVPEISEPESSSSLPTTTPAPTSLNNRDAPWTDVNWSTLEESVKLILSANQVEAFEERLIDQVIMLTGAERAILFTNVPGGLLEVVFQRSIRSSTTGFSKGVVERAMMAKTPLLVRDIATDRELAVRESIRELEIRTVLVVPLIAPPMIRKEMLNLPDPLGLIYVDSRESFHRLSDQHLALIEILANHAAIALVNHLLRTQLQAETESYRSEVYPRYPELIGESKAFMDVRFLIERLADKDIRILISGEIGTGKDLVARMLHKYGDRRNKPFVPLDCHAIPEELLESELFGIEKGIATGVSARPGVFEWANEGIIYLDHIEDMGLPVQAKLLRVLQEGRFQPVGSKRMVDINIRFISASRVPPHKLTEDGKLRTDLFYRLNGVTIEIPPLRNRTGDIPLLAQHFLERFGKEQGRNVREFSKGALAALLRYSWPGNIQELENRIRRAVVFCTGSTIAESDLNLPTVTTRTVQGLRQKLNEWERDTILKALSKTDGNVSQAAAQLRFSRMALTRLIKKHKIDLYQFRKSTESSKS